jgi:RNA polymerase sigma factor (sigma-70 family)
MTTHRKHPGHDHEQHDTHRGHDGHDHAHEQHDGGHDRHDHEHDVHRGHGHGGDHGHDEHDAHHAHAHDGQGHAGHGHDGHSHDGHSHDGHSHAGHGHGDSGYESQPGRAELERDLGVLIGQAREHFDTPRGTHAYERIVTILTRPGMRVARGKLEDLLPRGEVNSDDVNEIVFSAHFQLYQMLDRYQPGTPVIPWFSTIVRNKAIDFVRQRYHTRAQQPPDFLHYDDVSRVITAREDNVDMRLDIQEILHGLAPENQQVLSLLESGHSTAEIAVLLDESESWVRARRRALRVEFGALR